MESLKGKLTEEEFLEILKKCDRINQTVDLSKGFVVNVTMNLKNSIENLKKQGIIKQNPVEKAEEITMQLYRNNKITDYDCKIIKAGFEHLKKQLEEKK